MMFVAGALLIFPVGGRAGPKRGQNGFELKLL